MGEIDQFQSLFRRAAKPVFLPDPPEIRKVLGLGIREERVRGLLGGLLGEGISVSVLEGEPPASVSVLMDRIEAREPDLLLCPRFYGCPEPHPRSLGQFVDVLAQYEGCPVLLLPAGDLQLHRVMVATDRLSGDARLCSAGALFTPEEGTLVLAHVEDSQGLERILDAISRIPWIDTERAREDLEASLLGESREWIESVTKALHEAGRKIEIRSIVTKGRSIEVYRKLLHEQEADLLVMNTMDEGQVAMRGMAYAMAIEFTETGVLLL